TSLTVGGKALSSRFYKENGNGKTISWLFGVNVDILASDASKPALPVGATITVTYMARHNGNAVIGSPCNG
ncbi:cell surface protein, partial [Bifidobacterium pseudocatenulatum]|nr:cell surface protein [Bifidobacterium pseudocatenulatum]